MFDKELEDVLMCLPDTKSQIEGSLMSLVRQKDELILKALGMDIVANSTTKTIQMINPELLRQLHFEIFPGEETLFLNDKPLLTFYAPESEMCQEGNTYSVKVTQKYKMHKQDDNF